VFSPATITANSGPQTVTLTIQTPATTAMNHHEGRNSVFFALLLLPLWGVRKHNSAAAPTRKQPLSPLMLFTQITMKIRLAAAAEYHDERQPQRLPG
jgi:hypothetical protein